MNATHAQRRAFTTFWTLKSTRWKSGGTRFDFFPKTWDPTCPTRFHINTGNGDPRAADAAIKYAIKELKFLPMACWHSLVLKSIFWLGTPLLTAISFCTFLNYCHINLENFVKLSGDLIPLNLWPLLLCTISGTLIATFHEIISFSTNNFCSFESIKLLLESMEG